MKSNGQKLDVKLKSLLRKEKNPFGKYDEEIEVSFRVKGDGKVSVLQILRHLEYNGSIGHSHGVIIDPEGGEMMRRVGWDGDGSDMIMDLKVDGKKLPKDFAW